MVEVMNTNESNFLVTEIMKETKTTLSEYKKEVISTTVEQKKYDFATYLKKTGINSVDFPRTSGIGKFFRTFRYYPDISQTAKNNGIPMEYFFALKMIEGEGDPTNINVTDGGTGISQIQPDTFKWFSQTHLQKDYKVFSDNVKYKAYDYTILMKKYNNREKVNAIIAKKLLSIKSEKKANLTELTKLDDRFNPQIALDFSAKYVLYCKQKVNVSELSDKSWNQYKNDPKFDFQWLLALNGYNKGPNNFSKDFDGNHITNLKNRLEQYREYSKKLELYIGQGLSDDQILQKFNNIEPKKNTSGLEYKNISKDGQYKIYKFTLSADIDSYPIDNVQVLELVKAYQKFAGKIIEIVDEKGEAINPLKYSFKKGDVAYIREKII